MGGLLVFLSFINFPFLNSNIIFILDINRKRKMSGFGHRVYKNYDPRAKVIRKLAEEVFSIVGRDPLIEVILYCFSLYYVIDDL